MMDDHEARPLRGSRHDVVEVRHKCKPLVRPLARGGKVTHQLHIKDSLDRSKMTHRDELHAQNDFFVSPQERHVHIRAKSRQAILKWAHRLDLDAALGLNQAPS